MGVTLYIDTQPTIYAIYLTIHEAARNTHMRHILLMMRGVVRAFHSIAYMLHETTK